MSEKIDQLNDLLKQAEVEITQLRGDAEEYISTIMEFADGQAALELQIIKLNTQIQDLENLLDTSDSQLSESQSVIHNLKDSLIALRETASAALEQSRQSSSQVQMAANLFHIASKAQLPDEIEILSEAEKHIAQMREKVKRD